MNRSTPGLPVQHQLPEFTQLCVCVCVYTYIYEAQEHTEVYEPQEPQVHMKRTYIVKVCAHPKVI